MEQINIRKYIRSTIVGLILVVLSFLIGTEAAERGANAMIIVAAILAFLILLYLGRSAWWTLFLFPPLIGMLPLGIVQRLPLDYTLAVPICAYWGIMCLVRKARFEWRSVWWFDLATLILFAYFAFTYLRHPVSVNVLSQGEAKTVGGKDYITACFAFFYYIVISSIPYKWEPLKKVLKIVMYGTIFLAFFFFALGVVRGQTNISAMNEAAETERMGGYGGIGAPLFMYLLSRYKITELVFSIRNTFLCLISLVAVLMGGFREALLDLFSATAAAAFFRKQFLFLLSVCAIIYGALVYCGTHDLTESWPYGVQRVLSMFPGVKVSKAAKDSAEDSAEWRIVMWRWAMDPRTGYIKDYMWGDGYGQDMAKLRRWYTGIQRGMQNAGDQEYFAETGTWHSGPISTIHRTGYVGLGVVTFWLLSGLVLVLFIGRRIANLKDNTAFYYIILSFPGWVTLFYISAKSYASTFEALKYAVMAKVAYVEAMRAGAIAPFQWRHHYTPLTLQQIEQEAAEKQIVAQS